MPIKFTGATRTYGTFTAMIDDIWLEEDTIYCYVTNLTGNPKNTTVVITVRFQITDGDAEREEVFANASSEALALQDKQRTKMKLWSIQKDKVPVGPFYIKILNTI